MTQKPLTGKYKFNTFVDLNVSTQFNSVGIPLKKVLYHFNNGDVIDVQKMFFNDKSQGWEAEISAITEQNRTVPFSVLNKVSDNTPISANISRTEKTFNGSTDGMVLGGGKTNNTNKQNVDTPTTSNSLFNQKNILIGLVLIGSIYGLLKITKVIN